MDMNEKNELTEAKKEEIQNQLAKELESDLFEEAKEETLDEFFGILTMSKFKPRFDNFIKKKFKDLVNDYVLSEEFKKELLVELEAIRNKIFKNKFYSLKETYVNKIMEKKVKNRLTKTVKNNETQWYTVLKTLSGPFDATQTKLCFLNELDLDQDFKIEIKETTKLTKRLENILIKYMESNLKSLNLLLKDYKEFNNDSQKIKKWIAEKLKLATNNEIEIRGEFIALNILDFDINTKNTEYNKLEITLNHPRLLQNIVYIAILN